VRNVSENKRSCRKNQDTYVRCIFSKIMPFRR